MKIFLKDKNIKKLKIIVIIISFFVISLLILFTLNIKENGMFNRIVKNAKQDEEANIQLNDFIIKDNEGDSVNIIFSRENGISEIQYPTGFELYCKGKQKVSIDFRVEEEKEYVFKITDSIGQETYEKFTTPKANIQLTKGNLNITLDDIVTQIRQSLNSKNIATNFIKMAIGDNEAKDTTTTKIDTIFSKWKSFGDGNWGYDNTNNYIYNTKNSYYMTGYYDPDGNYENIEIEFEAITTDSDDDMIGSLVRFNSLENNLYSSYAFLLDRHDNGGGVGYGTYNGINKVVNNVFINENNLTRLSCNSSNVWTRNKWQKYKFVAKGTTISAYLDEKLIATATDDSILSGTVGFVSYSQAYTYFRNIKIITTRLRTFGEIIEKVDWNSKENNIIINVNNETDSDLSKSEVIEIMNSNNVYYFALGSETNKEEVEQLLQNINNRGKYLNSSDIQESVNIIADYLTDVLKLK